MAETASSQNDGLRLTNVVSEKRPIEKGFAGFNFPPVQTTRENSTTRIKCTKMKDHLRRKWAQKEIQEKIDADLKESLKNEGEKQKALMKEIVTKSGKIPLVFTDPQLQELRKAYEKSHYIDIFAREHLADKIWTSEKMVRSWFKNERRKCPDECDWREIQKENLAKEKEKSEFRRNLPINFNDAQVQILKEHYKECQYPHIFMFDKMAKAIGETENMKIEAWFKKQRAKERHRLKLQKEEEKKNSYSNPTEK